MATNKVDKWMIDPEYTKQIDDSIEAIITQISEEMYTIEQADLKFTAKYVGSTRPDASTIIAGDTHFNPTSGAFSIWNGSAWGELSMNSPKGTVNFNTNDARLVIPVGTDKWAT